MKIKLLVLFFVIGALSYLFGFAIEHYFVSFEGFEELIIPAIALILATSIGLARVKSKNRFIHSLRSQDF